MKIVFHTDLEQHVRQLQKLSIYSLHIRSDIQMRFATTLVTSRAANTANVSREALFHVTLPNEAFISNFTMEIDGVIYPGDVQEKQKAKKAYDRAKKRGQSAGHVSQSPRDTNKFKVQVNVAAFSKVTFNLTYQELLKRKLGVYAHKVYINPGQPVDDLRVDVSIQESRDITTLHVSPIRSDILTNQHSEAENSIAVVSRPSPKSAMVSYRPSVEQQSEKSPTGLAGQFVIEYDIERSKDAGDLLVVNGYFVHFFAPKVERRIPKDVMFILDVSGSMDGTKMDQVKVAMFNVLGDLKEGDSFNIQTFESTPAMYKPKMIPATQQSIIDAKTFVQGLRADGGTNINQALVDGIRDMMKIQTEDARSPVIVFLTDGQASSGVVDRDSILNNVQQVNSDAHVPVFTLAFGKGADWDLVKKIAIQNDGVAKKIYEDSDADLQIAGFYDELAVTLLNNVTIRYLGDTVDEGSITGSQFKNYFRGSEMVVAGKLEDPTSNTVNLEIFGGGVDGNLVLSLQSDGGNIDLSQPDVLTKVADFKSITEKTWAYLTIKQLLKKMDGETDTAMIEQLKSQALDLSLKHGFVTPLTSMVVTKPEKEQTADEADSADQGKTKPMKKPSAPKKRKNRYRGRGSSGGGGGDPHFMVAIHGLEHPICFDVSSKHGEVHNLLKDPVHDITINAGIIKEDILNKHGEPKTFIGEVAVQLKHHVIVVTPTSIRFDKKVLKWKQGLVRTFGNNEFEITDRGHALRIRFNFGAEIVIMRHVRGKDNPSHKVDYLNVYLNNEDAFSKHTVGLLGQFVNGQKHITLRKIYTTEHGKEMAKLRIKEGPAFADNVKGNLEVNDVTKSERPSIRARLISRPGVVKKETALCWMVHKQFEEKLYGPKKAFLVPTLVNV